MKSEEEFLASMWSEIDAKEKEAFKRRSMLKANRRLFIREICSFGIIALLLALGALASFFAKGKHEIVYIVAVLLLSAAFFTEKTFYSKLEGVATDEKRGYY